MNIYRLKQSEIEEMRLRLLDEQNHICALCGKYIAEEQAVLDHCHETGHIRSVLHRSCNSSEGRILAFAHKRCQADDPMTFIQNLVKYWQEDFTHQPIHPSHLLDEEKERRQLKKKLKTYKTEKKKLEVKARIKELNEIIKRKTSR